MKNSSKITIYSPAPKSDVKKEDFILGKSYSNFNITKGSSNSDTLIRKWDEDRKITSSDLNIRAFPIDKKCMGTIGTKFPHSVRNSCTSCILIQRLFARGEEDINKLLVIQSGINKGLKLYISFTHYLIDNMSDYQLNNNEYKNISYCSNYFIISCLMEHEMKKFKMPGLPIFVWAYGCGTGVITINKQLDNIFTQVIEKKHNGSLNVLKKVHKIKNPATLILMQLCINLLFLAKYSFSHGNPSLKNLIITNKKSDIKYENYVLKTPFTLHIIPSGNSSMKSENKLLYHKKPKKNIKLKSYLENTPNCLCVNMKDKDCEIKTRLLKQYSNVRVVYFKINTLEYFRSDAKTELNVNTSWDLYSFLIALMANKIFYNNVISDPLLHNVWKSMWHKSEYNDVLTELLSLQNHENVSYIMISNMLCKFHLKLTGLDFLWRMLETRVSV
jgi:hypothetical protein